jgi:hypothetical protein
MAAYLSDIVTCFPIVSIEDGMSEDDWVSWKILTELLVDKCQLIGDDLFVTNTARLAEGVKKEQQRRIGTAGDSWPLPRKARFGGLSPRQIRLIKDYLRIAIIR